MQALSKADQEVLLLLSEGVPDHEVCRRLKISLQALSKAIKRIEERSSESDDAGRFYERTLRLRAENRATSLEARFQALMQILPNAVLVVDGRSGAIKEANDVACNLFGLSRPDLLSKTVEDLVPPELQGRHPAFRLGFLASVRKREMGYHPPIFGVRADGTRIEMAIALTATSADDDVMVVCTEHMRWRVSLKRASRSKAQTLADRLTPVEAATRPCSSDQCQGTALSHSSPNTRLTLTKRRAYEA